MSEALDLFQANVTQLAQAYPAEAAPDWPIVIRVAGEPQGKGRARPFVNKYTKKMVFHRPDKTKNYETTLSLAAQDVMGERPPLEGPLEVELVAIFSIAPSWSKAKQRAAHAGTERPCRTPDADNILKVCDALNGIVWGDDRQIVDARVVKRYGTTPGITVRVRPAT
jgi:Holliday junction resolvase RusA-like endonuclease